MANESKARHHQEEEIYYPASSYQQGRMNLNTAKSMVFKGVHDRWGRENEQATTKSKSGLSLVHSTTPSFLSFSFVRRPCSPLPHDDRRYRFMTMSGNGIGNRTSTTAGPALQNFPHFEIQCPQWINSTQNCPMSISQCSTMQCSCVTTVCIYT